MTMPPANRSAAIGLARERVEDLRFLGGRGQYIDDVTIEGMLHGVVLRSPIAHARIRTIDPSAALAMPGIKAVFTARDLGANLRIPLRAASLPGYERSFLQPPLGAV